MANLNKNLKTALTLVGPTAVHKHSILDRALQDFSITPLLQKNMCRAGQEIVFPKAHEIMEVFRQAQVTAKEIDSGCDFSGKILWGE